MASSVLFIFAQLQNRSEKNIKRDTCVGGDKLIDKGKESATEHFNHKGDDNIIRENDSTEEKSPQTSGSDE